MLKAGAISLAGISAAVLVVLLLARAIARRNRDMRLVLDTVDQAIFTVRPDGQLLEERSQVAQAFSQGPSLWQAFGAVDANVGRWLKIGWDELLEGLMPFEVSLEHLPRQLDDGSRTWRIEYKPIRATPDGPIEKWLVVLSDISSELERQRAESVGSDLVRLLEALSKDRRGVITFIAEANRLVDAIVTNTSGDDLARDLHTLKGIAAMNGLESLARLVHQLEERLTDGQFDALDRRRLETAWASFENRLAFITKGSNSIEVTRSDLDDLLVKLQAVPGSDEVRARMATLTHEPARLPLERAAAHARVLAKRLGREEPVITIDAGALRLPDTFSDFWACFVHVVRNAVDHGLEQADARLAKGKPAAGRLTMRILEGRDGFALEVEDDGRGIDFEALATLAKNAALPSSTRADLVRVLFVDGVTTRTSVSEVSGRGIGMGALLRSVEALGGEIDVESELGAFTRFRFRFPRPGSKLALAA